MKKLITVLLAVSLLLLAGCGGKSDAKALDLEAFTADVLKTVEYDDELIALSEKNVANYYKKLPSSGVAAYKIYVSATSGTTNELAVFQCENANAVSAVKEAVEARLQMQRENYENYIPAEVSRLDDALIKTSGNYVLLSVSPDNDAVDAAFKAALK